MNKLFLKIKETLLKIYWRIYLNWYKGYGRIRMTRKRRRKKIWERIKKKSRIVES
jgi:hypothetical protein